MTHQSTAQQIMQYSAPLILNQWMILTYYGINNAFVSTTTIDADALGSVAKIPNFDRCLG